VSVMSLSPRGKLMSDRSCAGRDDAGPGRRRVDMRSAIWLTLVLLLGGCADVGNQASPGFVAPADRGLDQLVWLADGSVYVSTIPESARGAELWRARPDGHTDTVELESILGCASPAAISSVFAVGDSLGLAGRCPDADYRVVVAVPGGEQADVVMTLPVPVEHVTVVDDRDLAYGGFALGSCRLLVQLLPDGPMPLTVSPDTGTAELVREESVALSRLGPGDCVEMEESGWPVLSRDRERLGFAVSEGSAGVSGSARRSAPVGVYVFDRGSERAELVAGGFTEVNSLAMSDDGERLVVTGRMGSKHGIWWVSLQTREVEQVAEGKYFSIAFSPEQDHVAVVHYDPGSPGRRTIEVVPLPSQSG
jgi:hypothetical protein